MRQPSQWRRHARPVVHESKVNVDFLLLLLHGETAGGASTFFLPIYRPLHHQVRIVCMFTTQQHQFFDLSTVHLSTMFLLHTIKEYIQNRSLFLTHTSRLLIHLFQDSNNVATIPFSSLASQTCEPCHGIRPSHHIGTTKKLKKILKKESKSSFLWFVGRDSTVFLFCLFFPSSSIILLLSTRFDYSLVVVVY